MEDELLEIINNYGVKNQLKHLQSEVYELTEAILCGDDNYHVTEEIADVMVMLKQFQLWYKIKDEEIQDIMKFKIDRQLKRIAESKEHLIV